MKISMGLGAAICAVAAGIVLANGSENRGQATASLGASLSADNHNETKQDAKPAAAGSIAGKVVWDGERPEQLKPLDINAKTAEGCCTTAMDTTNPMRLIHKDGGIANVVLTVAVKDMPVKVPEDVRFAVDQKCCRFEPHVLVMPVGATLHLLNSDKVNHNVHTYPTKNDQINKNVAGGGKEEQKLEKAEVIKVGCDIHTWMNAWVVVTDDPVYGISGADGSFKLDGLPDGTYKVEWWHEDLGKGKTEEVKIEGGKAAELTVKLNDSSKGKKKAR